MVSVIISATYIQVHFRLDFMMETTNMSPNQTASKHAVWSEFILFAVYATKLICIYQMRDDTTLFMNGGYRELVLSQTA